VILLKIIYWNLFRKEEEDDMISKGKGKGKEREKITLIL